MLTVDWHCTHAQITLTSFPPGFASIPFDSIISVPTRTSAGAQLIGNLIINNRGRGISLQSSNGIIANNTIMNMGPNIGITIGPNNYFGESDFADNVLVRSHALSWPAA